eukprot:498414_1
MQYKPKNHKELFTEGMSTSARKFLLNKLDNSDDDESSTIEWELPTRRKFISLTKDDFFGQTGNQSFSSMQRRASEVKIDESPLLIDNEDNNEIIFSEINNNNQQQKTQYNRCSIRKSSKNLIATTIQKIFDEQNKMREEIQKQFQQFNEYKEIENMEKEMQIKQENKLKQEEELKHKELEKQEQREENLQRLEHEKEIELQKIKEMISLEFTKRDDELIRKQNEIEELKQVLKEKITDQDDLNDTLKEKASENEELINTLKNKLSELQNNQQNLVQDDEIEQNKKEISLAENKIEDVEMKQEEILKEINDNMEIHENLENEQKELEENEIELKEEQKHLETEKTKEIKKRSKNAYKKFDIRRANIIMECEIDFENIRERKSLLNTDDMMENIKLKMRKQFKEQMMKLRLQLNKNIKLPHTKINNSFFGDGNILFACSSNSEMCACLGINGIFHIIDVKNGEGIYMQNLKSIICIYDENLIEEEITNVNGIHMEWDINSILLGVLLEDCKWVGVWNSLTKQFYEFSVDECNDIVTSFAWSDNKLLLGMNNGDIYIKDMYKIEEE